MKRVICAILALMMVLAMAACGSGKDSGKEGAGDTMSLQEIVDAVQKDVPDLPDVMSQELTDDIFEYFAFAKPREGVEGIASDALVNATAHSVVVLRAADEETAKSLAEEVDANKDPRKWICVEAEKSIVKVHGSTVLLVMSSEQIADAVAANFDALWE